MAVDIKSMGLTVLSIAAMGGVGAIVAGIPGLLTGTGIGLVSNVRK